MTKILPLIAALACAGVMAHAVETAQEEAKMLNARGVFDVETTPTELDGPEADEGLGRFALVKHYHGPLEARGTGQMLTTGSPASGSAAYVAIERVRGTLDGREGSFVLAHRGTMTAAGSELDVTIAPDSGTGELAGISGRLEITVEDGQHHYDLAYELPAAP